MSCRSTPANSAATTFARLNCGLSDVQTLSAFHVLRAESAGAPAPTEAEWREYLALERSLVELHPNLSDARRASLLRRMDAAAKQPLPDGPTWAALRRLRRHTQAQTRELELRYTDLAERLGISEDEVRARAATYAAEVDTRRDAPAPAGYTSITLATYREQRLPVDRQTVHALYRLEQDAYGVESQAPRRVTRQPVISEALAEVGYDPYGGRLEVVFHSRPNRVYAYRNVPASVHAEMVATDGSAGRAWNEHIRDREEYRYANAAEAEADALQRRCGSCGQWASPSGHACPSPTRSVPDAPAAEDATRAALEEAARQAVFAAELSAFVNDVAEVASATEMIEGSDAPARSRQEQAALDELRAFTGEPEVLVRNDVRSVADPVTAVRTMLPEPRIVRAATARGPVAIPTTHFGDLNEQHEAGTAYILTGALVVSRAEDGTLVVDNRRLQCNCPAYQRNGHCPHVDLQRDAARRRLNPALARQEELAQAQAEAEAAVRSDWMRSQEYAAEARARWASQDPEGLYSENYLAFNAVVREAEAKQAAGEQAIPYMREDATGGLCSRDGGRSFGIEIEFDFPDWMSEEDRQMNRIIIGQELYDAQLTESEIQREYHSAEERGYKDTHLRGWSYEEDGSVDGGEIVSPIMWDEAETWTNVEKVCDIIRRNGGIANAKTGSHVHVGAGTYGTDIANHTELVRMVNQHEDVLYRVASNPDNPTGEHRPIGFCQPNPDAPMTGYRNLVAARDDHEGHDLGLNLQSMIGDGSDHVEFRHWDGTLNPAAIQAQVKISAAMVEAAQRNAGVLGVSQRPREPLGAHEARLRVMKNGSRRKLNRREKEQDTATARSLADTLFIRREDKEQFAALFAVTRWQNRRLSRRFAR